MTGEQLEKFIDMLYSLLEDFEERVPEHKSEINEIFHSLVMLDKVSSEERDEFFEEEMSKTMTSYALSNLNKIIVGSPGTKHIDYSPMHGMIAKYGLKLSNMCEYLGITSNVRTSISKNETVHMDVLIQISDFLECQPSALYTFIDSQEKSKREMKELMVKGSKTVTYKGKETPIPTAILKEIRDTDNNSEQTTWFHVTPKNTFFPKEHDTVSSEKDGWVIYNNKSNYNTNYIDYLKDKPEMQELLQQMILNAAKNLNNQKDNDNKED